MSNTHASYLRYVFDPSKQNTTIRKIRSVINSKKLEFDGFIVTGISGIVIGGIVARSMKKDLVVVRKDDDRTTHSSFRIENFKFGKRYIFLDDLISSGNTFKNVKIKMSLCNEQSWLYGYGKKIPSRIIGGIFYDGAYKTGEGVQYIGISKLNTLID